MMFLNIQVISSYTLVLNLLAKSLRILSLVALYCHTQSLAREKKTEQKRKKRTYNVQGRAGGRCGY